MATKHSKQILTRGHIGKPNAKAVLNPQTAKKGYCGPNPKDPFGYQKILIVSDVINSDTCKLFCDYANAHLYAKEQAGIDALSNKKSANTNSELNIDVRDAFRIPTTEMPDAILNDIFLSVITKHIEPFYKGKVEWWEEPNLLFYFKNGKYEPHADADIEYADINGQMKWGRSLDRDISILLYMNDGFTGGLLSFPGYNLKIQPKPGMLVAFPSSSEYMHAAEPTESGCRLVLVSWAALEGVPRVSSKHPYAVVYKKRADKNA